MKKNQCMHGSRTASVWWICDDCGAALKPANKEEGGRLCCGCLDAKTWRDKFLSAETQVKELEAELQASGETSVARCNALIAEENRVKELEAELKLADRLNCEETPVLSKGE